MSLKAPDNVRVVPVEGEASLLVTWERPKGAGGMAYFYRIFRRREGSPQFSVVFQGKDFYSHKIVKLRPFTKYEVCVQSYGVQSDGPSSKVVTARTAALTPTAPLKFRVAEAKMEEITVAWSPPTHSNGEIRAYLLFCDLAGTDSYDEYRIDPTARQYVVKDLFKDSLYRFQILAINDAGEGPFTPIVSGATEKDPINKFKQLTQTKEGRKPSAKLKSEHSSESISGRSQRQGVVVNHDSPTSKRKSITTSRTNSAISLSAPVVDGYDIKATPWGLRLADTPKPEPVVDRSKIKKRASRDDWQMKVTLDDLNDGSAQDEWASTNAAAKAATTPSKSTSGFSFVAPTSAKPVPATSFKDNPVEEPIVSNRRSFFDNMARANKTKTAQGTGGSTGELLDQLEKERQEKARVAASQPKKFKVVSNSKAEEFLEAQRRRKEEEDEKYRKKMERVAQENATILRKQTTDLRDQVDSSGKRTTPLTPTNKQPRRTPSPTTGSHSETSNNPQNGDNSSGITPQTAEELLGSFQEMIISDGNKTIRGKKRGVRSKLAQFSRQASVASNPVISKAMTEEQNTIVLYISSITGIRETYINCDKLQKLFYNMRLKVKLKDISMSSGEAKELEDRLPGAVVPQVFVNGAHFGNCDRIIQLNEQGTLAKLLEGFEQRPLKECELCGGKGFILCSWCKGSKKSLHNPFEVDHRKTALRCTICNENGLQRCADC